MWQPQPGWHPLPSGTSPSTVGVWRAVVGEEPVAVKRLAAPGEHDPPELSDPQHFAYWRRGADVVTSGVLAHSQGLRPPVRSYAVEDVEGVVAVLPLSQLERELAVGSSRCRRYDVLDHNLEELICTCAVGPNVDLEEIVAGSEILRDKERR